MLTTIELELRVVAVDPNAGEGRREFGERAPLTAKQTGGAYSLVEVVAPPGLTVSLHVPGRKVETFAVPEGDVAFSMGAMETVAGSGSVQLASRGVPQGYAVGGLVPRRCSSPAPEAAEGFVRASSVPAKRRGAPPAELAPPPDVAAIAPPYGAEILDAA